METTDAAKEINVFHPNTEVLNLYPVDRLPRILSPRFPDGFDLNGTLFQRIIANSDVYVFSTTTIIHVSCLRVVV